MRKAGCALFVVRKNVRTGEEGEKRAMKKGAWGLVCLLALLAALLLPVGALAEGTDVVATLEIDGQTTDYATGGDYDTAEAALRAAWADAQGKTATLRLRQSVQLEDSQLWMSYNVSGTTRLTLEMDEGVVLSRELPYDGGCVIQIVFGSLEFSSGTIKATSPSIAYQGNCGIRVTYDQGELILSGGNVNIESKTRQYNVTGVELSAGSLQMTAGSIVIDHRGSSGNQMDFTAGVYLEDTATAVIGGSAKIEVTEADKHIDVGVFGVRMAGQSLTISGDPVISATLSLTEPPAAGETYNVYGIDVQRGSLTVEGAPQVSATNTTAYGCAVGLHVADGASAVVRGGDYTGTAQSNEGYGLQAAGTGLLENLSGGTFSGNKGSVAADVAVRELLTFGYSYFDDSDSEVGSDAISQMILTQDVRVKENPAPVPELRHVAQTYTAETATITAVTLPGATVYYGTDKDSLAGASVTAASDGSVTISLSGLTPAQDYTYYLQASLDGKTSPVVETRFTTEPALSASYRDDISKKKVCADCVGLIKGYCWTGGGKGVSSSPSALTPSSPASMAAMAVPTSLPTACSPTPRTRAALGEPLIPCLRFPVWRCALMGMWACMSAAVMLSRSAGSTTAVSKRRWLPASGRTGSSCPSWTTAMPSLPAAAM